MAVIPAGAIPALASLVFLMVLGKVMGSETRLLMAALVALQLYPDPTVVVGVGVLAIVFHVVEVVRGAK